MVVQHAYIGALDRAFKYKISKLKQSNLTPQYYGKYDVTFGRLRL